MVQRIAKMAGAVVAIGIAAWVVPVAAAPAQVPPPEVSAAGFDGSDSQTLDCRGNPDDAEATPGRFVVTRDGQTDESLAVDVEYSNDQLGLPDPVVIPAGSASVEVEVPIWPSVTISLIPGADYTVASDSTTFDVQVVTSIGDLGCNLQGIAEVRDVVEVGQVPATIDLSAQGIGVNEPPALDIVGSQPPGASLQRDGSWRGATTAVGTYRATAYYCDADNWCPQALRVVVDVVERTAVLPPARPAEPVTGAANFTG